MSSISLCASGSAKVNKPKMSICKHNVRPLSKMCEKDVPVSKADLRKTARCSKNCAKSRCLTTTSESKNRSNIFFYSKKITKTASHSTNLQVDTKIIRNLRSSPSLQESLRTKVPEITHTGFASNKKNVTNKNQLIILPLAGSGFTNA